MLKFASVALSVIALTSTALAVKAFLPTPVVQSRTQQWEYMQVQQEAVFRTGDNPDLDTLLRDETRDSKQYSFDMARLTTLGKQGWEVVGVAAAPETVHHNFGSSQYVTGLQPNVRAGSVTLLLKRPLHESELPPTRD